MIYIFPIYIKTMQRIIKLVFCEHLEGKVVFHKNQLCSLSRNTAKVNLLLFLGGVSGLMY